MSKIVILALLAASCLAAKQHIIECRPPKDAKPEKTPGGRDFYTGVYIVDGVVKGSCVTFNPKGSMVSVSYLSAPSSADAQPCPPGTPRLGCVPAGARGPYVPSQAEHDAQPRLAPAGGAQRGPVAFRPTDPIRQVGVGLGKIPGPTMRMALTTSEGGSVSGRLQGRAPAGSRLLLKDAEGRIISEGAVNPSDGSFELPGLRSPVGRDFTACLQAPGAAAICSAPGALQPLFPPAAR
jgi:hypothetical protein